MYYAIRVSSIPYRNAPEILNIVCEDRERNTYQNVMHLEMAEGRVLWRVFDTSGILWKISPTGTDIGEKSTEMWGKARAVIDRLQRNLRQEV